MYIYWFIYGIEALFWQGTYIFSAVSVLFSLFGTAITAFICVIKKSIKENTDEEPKNEDSNISIINSKPSEIRSRKKK